MDKHDLLCAVKNLASELGRTPTADEARKVISKHHITKQFGGYVPLCIAAGLEPIGVKNQYSNKVTSEIFLRNLPDVIDNYVPTPRTEKQIYSPTLVIGDTHFPFHSQKVLDWIYGISRTIRPLRIVQVGDLYDMYAHSRFARSMNMYSPQQEQDEGRKHAETMWKTLKEISPKAECIQLRGNHDIRPMMRTMEAMPALENAVAGYLTGLMTFTGVTTMDSARDEYTAEGIQFIHGYRTKPGDHSTFTGTNIVCGHSHQGSVQFKNYRGQILWELNAGLVGDPESKALSWTPQKTTHWTHGCGFIDELGPRFIPY